MSRLFLLLPFARPTEMPFTHGRKPPSANSQDDGLIVQDSGVRLVSARLVADDPCPEPASSTGHVGRPCFTVAEGSHTVADYWPDVERPHVADSTEQYEAAANALGLAGAMWQALANDDDQTTPPGSCSTDVRPIGGLPIRSRLPTPRCAWAQHRRLPADGCASTVRLLADGSFLVMCVKVRPLLGGIDTYTDELTPVVAWVFVIAKIEGEWRIAGHPDGRPGHKVVGLIDVVPPASSPVS